MLDFAGGAIGTLVTSFDVWAHSLPHIEIYGTAGTLTAPDPNSFGGPVRLRRAGDVDWQDVPVRRSYAENSRGLGVADLARAVQAGRPHRASGDLAYHVLDVMQSLLEAAAGDGAAIVASTCERPAPLPEGLRAWDVDD